jgi:hypothetical protein
VLRIPWRNRGPRQPGLYRCRSPKCRYAFIHSGHGVWHGPIWPDTPLQDQIPRLGLHPHSWQEIDQAYGDCTRHLARL